MVDLDSQYTIGQSSEALAWLLLGFWMLLRGVELAADFGRLILLAVIFVACFWCNIPSIVSDSGASLLQRVVWATFCSVFLYFFAANISDWLLSVMFVAALIPILYELMGTFWGLEPIERWRNARLVISSIFSFLISPYLLQHRSIAARFIVCLIGSLLIAGSVEYFFRGGQYSDWMGTCLRHWDSALCFPFHFAWILLLALSLAWAGVSSAIGNHSVDYWITPRPVTTRSVGEGHYERMAA